MITVTVIIKTRGRMKKFVICSILAISVSGSVFASKTNRSVDRLQQAPIQNTINMPIVRGTKAVVLKLYPGPAGYQKSEIACNADPGCTTHSTCGINVTCCCNYQ